MHLFAGEGGICLLLCWIQIEFIWVLAVFAGSFLIDESQFPPPLAMLKTDRLGQRPLTDPLCGLQISSDGPDGRTGSTDRLIRFCDI